MYIIGYLSKLRKLTGLRLLIHKGLNQSSILPNSSTAMQCVKYAIINIIKLTQLPLFPILMKHASQIILLDTVLFHRISGTTELLSASKTLFEIPYMSGFMQYLSFC